MLTIAEEILLLFLDEQKGTFVRAPDFQLELALGGAVLMDLALANRVDTDPERLFVVDPTPIGNELLDEILVRVGESGEDRSVEYWLNDLREGVEALMERLIDSLVARGVLRRVEEKVLWVFESRRYPVIDDREEREVKRRITNALFSDEIPDPRDIVIISLVNACDLFGVILNPREVENVRARADQIARMDLIGQAVGNTIGEVRASILTMMSTM